MFQGANIDISKRQLTDPVLIGVYSTENNKVFFEYNVLLASIFNIHLHIVIRGQTGICQQDVKQNIIFTQASHIKCKVASSLDTGSV